MYRGNNWIGNYAHWSFDPTVLTKDEILVLKEQGKPWLSDEINASQEMLVERYRNMMIAFLPEGSPDDGFLVVGTGAVNDFSIMGGYFHLAGWLLRPANASYQAQPIAQLALSTPVADRVDVAYLDVYYDEINGVQDPNIVDPVIGVRTSCRLRLMWAVKVAEGADLPANGLDGNGLYHWRYKIATINRLAGNNTITAGMVIDNRQQITRGFATIGPISLAVETTLTSQHEIVFVSAGTPLHLPIYANVPAGKKYTLKNVAGGPSVVDAIDGKLIDGAASISLDAPGDGCTIVKDGANWQTIR